MERNFARRSPADSTAIEDLVGVGPDQHCFTSGYRPMSPGTLAWLIALLGWTLFICSAGLAGGAGFEPTDCWVAQTAREMNEGQTWRDFIIPKFSGETRMQKSPGPYWAVIAAARARGTPVDEVAARIPNVVAALLLVLTIFWLTRRIAGDRAAIFAGFAGASSVLVLYWSHRGASDLGVATFTTAALACFWVAAESEPPGRRRTLIWLLGYFAAGLGMLYKLPMTAVTVGLPMFLYVLLRNKWRVLASPVHLAGAIVFLLPWLPWAIMVLTLEPTAWDKWRVEFLDRFTGDLPNVREQKADPLSYLMYVVGPLLYCAPFSLSLPAAFGRGFQRQVGVSRDGQVFLLVWFLSHFAFFMASAGKELRYLLPALPPLFVLLGIELAAFFDPQRPRRERLVRGGVLAACVLIPLGMAGGFFALQYWFKQRGSFEGFAWNEVWPPYVVMAAIFSLGAILAAVLYARRKPHASFAALVVTMWATWLYGWSALGPVLVSQRVSKDFAQQLRARIPPDSVAELRQIGTQDPRHMWYADFRFPRIIDQLQLLRLQGGRRSLEREMWLVAQEMVRKLNDPQRVLLVSTLEGFATFELAAPRIAARLGLPTPPTYVWLRNQLGREDRQYVVVSNQPPPTWPPLTIELPDKYRGILEQRLREIEAEIGDLVPTSQPAAPATSSTFPIFGNGVLGAAASSSAFCILHSSSSRGGP